MHVVTFQKTSSTQGNSLHGQLCFSIAMVIGVFVGGTVFGTLATLLVVGLALAAVKGRRKGMARM